MIKTKQISNSLLSSYYIYYFFFALVCTHILFTSWIEEDAFITFRVVDNFVHGFGLRWNINERVQSYTNPLWLLLHIPLYAVINNIVLSTWILCWSCLIGTILLARYTFTFNPIRFTTLFLIPIQISPTLTLFFTSGLETPLLSLLFVCFGFTLVRIDLSRQWFWLSIITACSAVTRLDTIIFYAPIWLTLLYQQYKNIRWQQIILGSFPLPCWLLFSLFYYGFFLPNTALAKLYTGLPLRDYIYSGLAYILDFIVADPLASGLTVLAIIYFPFQAWRPQRRRDADGLLSAGIALGIAFYCLYVIYIGGYQLGLRMLSLPVIAACWLWLWQLPKISNNACYCIASSFIIIQSMCAFSPTERANIPFIAHQKISGFPWAQYLFTANKASFFPYHLNSDVITHKPNVVSQKIHVVVAGGIGQLAYYQGPYLIIIDPFALSDPLLARLPARSLTLRRVGHIDRAIPEGYLQAVETGLTKNMKPPLRKYYEKLRLITQGGLFNPLRLETLLRFNLGEYEPLRKDYLRNFVINNYS